MASDDFQLSGNGGSSAPKGNRSSRNLSPKEKQNSALLIGLGILVTLIGLAMKLGVTYKDVFGIPLRTTSSGLAGWLGFGALAYYGSFLVGFLGFIIGYKYVYNTMNSSAGAAVFIGILLGIVSFVIGNAYFWLLLAMAIFYIIILPTIVGVASAKTGGAI